MSREEKTSRVSMLKEQFKNEYAKYGGQYIAIDREGHIIGSATTYLGLSHSFDGKERPYYMFPVMGPNGERPVGITIQHRNERNINNR